MKLATYLSSALILFSCGYVSVASAAQTDQSQTKTQKASQYTDRIIVKMKSANGIHQDFSSTELNKMVADAGFDLHYIRAMGEINVHVLGLNEMLSLQEVQAITKTLENKNELIEYAQADARMMPMATTLTGSTYVNRQWNLQSSANQGLNLPDAWDYTTGSSSVVVAVLDTGILRDHSGFDNARLLTGYDMVSVDVTGTNAFLKAGDTDGQENNPNDEGNWVTTAESQNASGEFFGCTVMDSSWHGTHVAGIIAAKSTDGSDVVGIDWNAQILPVRVLGKCGGYTSDIADGIRWAAGLAVTGLTPEMATPSADIINMSFGSIGSCDSTIQSAINAARTAGSVVIVAAGNDAAQANDSTPANCENVVVVAAHKKNGVVTDDSNTGTVVDVMAPGGESSATCDDTHESIYSLGNDGLTTENNNVDVCRQGTSMAAAHVSGLAALMLARNSELTPDEIEAALKSSARSFVDGGTCTVTTCGAGIADAAAAIMATALPLTPTNFVIADESVETEIQLNWTDASLLETSFKIERSIDDVTFLDIGTVETDIVTFTDEDIVDGATSYYRLAGVNGAYTGAYTASISVTRGLSQPSSLAVGEVTTSSITLSWVDESNNESGYQVNRSSNGGDESPIYKRLAVLSAGTTSYTDSNVVDGQEYYYKVLALGGTANSEATEGVSARTPINTPTFLRGEASANQIEVSWTDNSESETGFQIERSLDGVTYAQIATVAMNETSYADTTVSASAFYYYRVRAYTESTNSEYSTIASLSTPSDTKGAGIVNPYLLALLLLTMVRVRSNKKS